MAKHFYKASSIRLGNFIEEATSTSDFLRFVRQNFEYLKSNIDKQNHFRKKQANLFKHQTLITLRQSVDDFIRTISKMCLDPIIQGISYAQIELRDAINKLTKIHQQSSNLIDSSQNHYAVYLDKFNKSKQQTQAAITTLQRIKQTQFYDFKEIMTLNGKGVPTQHYLEVQTQKQHLIHKIIMSQREETLCRQIINKVEHQLEADYKYAAETLNDQMKDVEVRVCHLRSRLADKCQQDIYQKLHFSGIFNWVIPQQNHRQIDKLEEFLRMEEEERPYGLETLEHRMSQSIQNQDILQKERLIAVGVHYKDNLKTMKQQPSEVCQSLRESSETVKSVEYNIAPPKDIEEGSPAVRNTPKQQSPFEVQLHQRQSSQPNSAFKPVEFGDECVEDVRSMGSAREVEGFIEKEQPKEPQQSQPFADIPKVLNCDMQQSMQPHMIQQKKKKRK